MHCSRSSRALRPLPSARMGWGALALAGGLVLALAPAARAADPSAESHAKGGSGAPAHAPAAAAEPAHGGGPKTVVESSGLSMQDLQRKLTDKIEQVRAARSTPAHGGGTHKTAHRTHARTTPSDGHAGGGSGAAAAAHVPHWSYAGAYGPQAWGAIKPEFSLCANGTRQSPIDIRDGIGVELPPVDFDYRESAFGVVDNGHTVQVNLARGNSIGVMGRRYDLLQFHFHRPSEERVDGRAYDMVVHLVHKDPEGRLAVVAVLISQGRSHPLVQQVWNNLPLEKNEELRAGETMDLNALLPPSRAYFTYMGSLTTPPCSEGVLWMVMKQPVELSPQQIGIFARLYPMNARPIQPVAGRMIKESVGATATASVGR